MPEIMETFHKLSLRVSALSSLANATDEAISRVPGHIPALDDALNLVAVLGEEIGRVKEVMDTLEDNIRALD